MAFPTRSTPEWSFGPASSRTFTVDLPPTIDPGDLLICVGDTSSGSSPVWNSSPTDSTSDAWTDLIASGNNGNVTGAAWYKIADGDEDAGTLTITYTSGFSGPDVIAGVIRIPAASWHGTTPPEGTAWASRTDDTTPAIPSLNPSGWDTEDTLWITFLLSNQDMTGIAAPTGYAFNTTEGQDWEQDTTGSGTPKMAVASIETAAASEGGQDWPAATNWSGVVDHLVAMIAVRPAAGDVTAPTLSSPSGTATGETTADLSVDSDEDCDAAVVVTQSSTTPTDTQINAGQDHTGAAADYDEALTGQTAGTINFAGATGLTAGTTYWAHFAAEDAAANKATPVTSASFVPGAVAYLDAADSSISANLTYAISAGTDRLLVGFVAWEDDDDGNPHVSSIAVGDQTATLGTEEVSPDEDPTSFWVGVVPFYLTESQIAAKTGDDIVVTWVTDAPSVDYFIAARSLQLASQAAPVEVSDSTEVPPVPATLTVAVSAKEDGAILAFFVSGWAGSDLPIVWDSPMNARTQDAGIADSTAGSLADDLHSGVDASVDVVATSSDSGGSNRIALVAVVIEPVAAAGGASLLDSRLLKSALTHSRLIR